MVSFILLPILLSSYASATPFGFPRVPDLHPRASCDGNTATTRTEWCDYDITTDYYNTVPDTGVTREYWLELTDVTVSPDGVSRTGKHDPSRYLGIKLTIP